MSITAIVFASTGGMMIPYGLRPSDTTFETREACYSHFEELEGWTERKHYPNLYHSSAPIKVYQTPIGAVFVTCWEG